jgi:superfamily I DNA/RNA helicase
VPALYPDAPESRRTLYVAVTRASLQLLLGTLGKWSPVLPLDEEEAQ